VWRSAENAAPAVLNSTSCIEMPAVRSMPSYSSLYIISPDASTAAVTASPAAPPVLE
jgi:hypothetical protein